MWRRNDNDRERRNAGEADGGTDTDDGARCTNDGARSTNPSHLFANSEISAAADSISRRIAIATNHCAEHVEAACLWSGECDDAVGLFALRSASCDVNLE